MACGSMTAASHERIRSAWTATSSARVAAIRSCGRWPRAVRAGRDEQVVRARRHGRAKQPLLGQMQVLGLMIRARRPYTCHSTRRPPAPGAVTPRPRAAALCQQVLSAYGDTVEPPRLATAEQYYASRHVSASGGGRRHPGYMC